MLTRSGLTYPEVSSKVRHDFFCQLQNSADGFGGLVVSMLASGTQVYGLVTMVKKKAN